MRTLPSLSNWQFSLHASAFAISSTISPFFSVHAFTATSPLPSGIELFSSVPNEFHVTLYAAALLCAVVKDIDKIAERKNDKTYFILFDKNYFEMNVYVFPAWVEISYNHVCFKTGSVIFAFSEMIGSAIFSV